MGTSAKTVCQQKYEIAKFTSVSIQAYAVPYHMNYLPH